MTRSSMQAPTRPSMQVTDPETGAIVGEVPRQGPAEAIAALERAAQARAAMTALSAHARADILLSAADGLIAGSEAAAMLIAREGIKTITEARGEVDRAAGVLRLSAEAARTRAGVLIPFDQHPGGTDRTGWSAPIPIGVVLGITPFNDPLNLVAHKLGPAIAAGCPMILKPHEATPLSALLLVDLLRDGLPPGAIEVVTGHGVDLVPPLLADDRIRLISFTGGLATGRKIAKAAGLTRLVMELGSNCATLVMADADLDRAARSCVSGAVAAAGQNCLHVQRIIAHREIYADLRERLVAGFAAVHVAPKLDRTSDMGCMIDAVAARRVQGFTDAAIAGGARLLAGGTTDGVRVAPTLIETVPDDDPLHRDEVFGPVTILIAAEDLDDAIARANAAPFGLQGAIFTNDLAQARRAIDGLDVGAVMVNDSTDYRLDAMPFGGTKHSGLGREGIASAVATMSEPKVACFRW
ncbi:MAG: aldehyde dehydrogenase family protein [Pseudomonadota bacterium]